MDSKIKSCHQGKVDSQSYGLVAVVKEDNQANFEARTNITNSASKLFVLCSCQILNQTNDHILYLSNDPNDFIYNDTKIARNYGVAPLKLVEDYFTIDYRGRNHSRTMPLTKEKKFQVYSQDSNHQYNSIKFKSIDSNFDHPSDRIIVGIPYEINFAKNRDTMNFHIRKNLATAENGRIGPSIAWFSQPSSIFEYLRTYSYEATGAAGDFTFDADNNNKFGVSKLQNEANSAKLNELPIGKGIVEIYQGTSVWCNVYNNLGNLSQGVSEINLTYNPGKNFLNTQVFNPDVTKGVSVKINIRNKEENFVALDSIASVDNMFNFYFINMMGHTSGGQENNSSQYIDNDNGNILGGLSYFPDKDYTYHNFFRQEHLKGFIAGINCINDTTISKMDVDVSKKTDNHASEHTTYNSFYDSSYAIDLNAKNDYTSGADCSKARAVGNFRTNFCGLHLNSDQELNDPNAKIFSDNPKYNQQTYILEMVIMGVALLIYCIFAFYYYNLELY